MREMGLAPTGFASIIARRGPNAQEPDAGKAAAARPACGRHLTRDAQWNRGAYLVEPPGPLRRVPHAARFPGRQGTRTASSPIPRKGRVARKCPNITPDPEDGIGRRRAGDLTYYLKTGLPEDRLPARR